tara:strand:- start:2784 stop:3752 length:969 start_codon:yes stop_codon:yes gene_type:complete
MAKTLSETQLKSAINNAILTVVNTCGKEVESAISSGIKAEYLLGSTIIEESDKIHLVEGEKRTGDSADKKVETSIRKSRTAIVDGLIEMNKFGWGKTKFLDAVRVASKFSETEFEDLSAEFNRTAIIELASVSDENKEKALSAVRAATEKAVEKDVPPPNVREIVKGFKPTARKSTSVPFPLKISTLLADSFDVDFFAKFSSEKSLSKKDSNAALFTLFTVLAENGMDVQMQAEVKRDAEVKRGKEIAAEVFAAEVAEVAEVEAADDAKREEFLVDLENHRKAELVTIDNIKTPEGEDFSYGSEAYEARRAELVAEGLEQAI